MREILFRGKRIDNGELVEGFYTEVRHYDDNSHVHLFIMIPEKMHDKQNGLGFWEEVIPETIGQFTGLTDKNGKKIFEGDILDHTIQAEVLTNRGVVVWDYENARWALQLNTMKPCFYMHNPKAVEVIGNIHDNPELLNGGNEDG